ncbi:hypothetical protein BD289DRAFT_144384 [Coniella lustricola]|uniref:Uncharacterized protein n=1 Tax=Coniella lustricola TaxID=2025994 RepID=A0A2T3AF05_9PEZI|nr:hypothetical protein BD289DRAFT_144384 [Coniella lustricola]
MGAEIFMSHMLGWRLFHFLPGFDHSCLTSRSFPFPFFSFLLPSSSPPPFLKTGGKDKSASLCGILAKLLCGWVGWKKLAGQAGFLCRQRATRSLIRRDGMSLHTMNAEYGASFNWQSRLSLL